MFCDASEAKTHVLVAVHSFDLEPISKVFAEAAEEDSFVGAPESAGGARSRLLRPGKFWSLKTF